MLSPVLASEAHGKVGTRSSSSKSDSYPSSLIHGEDTENPFSTHMTEGSRLMAHMLGLQIPGQSPQLLDLPSSMDAWSRLPNAYFGRREGGVGTSNPVAQSNTIYSEANESPVPMRSKGKQSTVPHSSHTWVQQPTDKGNSFGGSSF